MNTLEAMGIFIRVTEMASFTQAASSLGLPKASVSGAVKQLENLLGTQLLHRTTRKVQLTQDGLSFYERGKDLLADMDELQSMFQHGDAEISGRLRVDMSGGVAKNIVIPQLASFLEAHPHIELELSSTDRRVDVVREGFDCVLRVGTLADSSLVARPVGRFRLVNCASPAYLKRYGTPKSLDDLARHRLVSYVPLLGARSGGWEYMEGKESRNLEMACALTVNNAESYQAACLAGLGLIQAPEAGVRHLIKEGKLREVLPQFQATPMPVTLLYANRRHLPSRVRVFMEWLAGVMQPFVIP